MKWSLCCLISLFSLSTIVAIPSSAQEYLMFPIEHPTSSELIEGKNFFSQEDTENGFALYEFLIEGEDLDNWEALLSLLNYSKNTPAGMVSLREYYDTRISIREDECPNASTWNIIQETENTILYESQTEKCGNWPAIYSLDHVLDGEYNRFHLWYEQKTSEIDPESREYWIQQLLSVEIVNYNAEYLDLTKDWDLVYENRTDPFRQENGRLNQLFITVFIDPSTIWISKVQQGFVRFTQFTVMRESIYQPGDRIMATLKDVYSGNCQKEALQRTEFTIYNGALENINETETIDNAPWEEVDSMESKINKEISEATLDYVCLYEPAAP